MSVRVRYGCTTAKPCTLSGGIIMSVAGGASLRPFVVGRHDLA